MFLYHPSVPELRECAQGIISQSVKFSLTSTALETSAGAESMESGINNTSEYRDLSLPDRGLRDR